MAPIERIATLVNKLDCQARIKLKSDTKPETWTSNGIGFPVNGYIELHGPWPFREVEWIEINPVVIKHIDRLVPPKRLNYLEQISSFLEAESVNYSLVEEMVRIPFTVASN